MTISLLRSSTYPAPQQDKGKHHFRYAAYPHKGGYREADTVGVAKRFCSPVRWGGSGESTTPDEAWIKSDNPHLIIDTIKPAEDGNDVIVRMYESIGSRCNATLELASQLRSSQLSNTLEDSLAPIEFDHNRICVSLRPYQIMTLRLGVEC